MRLFGVCILSLAVSADQMLDDLTFAVLPSFDQMIAVVRNQGDPIMLDGGPVPDTLFTQAGNCHDPSLATCPQ